MSEQPGPPPPLSFVDMEPVLVLSHSYTYYAPREILAVRLEQPMVITLGASGSVNVDVGYKHFHICLADVVEDKVEGSDDESDEGVTVRKRVPIAPVHAAFVLQQGKLYYKHLGEEASLVAAKRTDAKIIRKPGVIVPLEYGQSVGMGVTEDAFGQPMWWYYVRPFPLKYLRRQVAAAAASRQGRLSKQ